MTVKPCNRPAVEAQKLRQIEFIDVFHSFYTYCAWSAFPRKCKSRRLV